MKKKVKKFTDHDENFAPEFHRTHLAGLLGTVVLVNVQVLPENVPQNSRHLPLLLHAAVALQVDHQRIPFEKIIYLGT